MMVRYERRGANAAVRIPFDHKVKIGLPQEKKQVVGYARNLSLQGMSVVGGFHVDPQEKVFLDFDLADGEVFEAEARVVRFQKDKENEETFGFYFEKMDDHRRELLKKHIDAQSSQGIFSQFSLLSEKILSGLTVTEILNHVYDSFRHFVPYDRIGFAKLSEDRRSLKAMWARSESRPLRLSIGYEEQLKGSSLLKVLRNKEARILNDLPAYLAKKPNSHSTRRIVKEGMKSSLTCPLIAFDRSVGFLFFSSRKTNVYQSTHVETFRFLAAQLSYAIEKAFLFEELMATQKRLEKANHYLQEMSEVDPLTGVGNRRFFDERLKNEWNRAWRNHHPLSLIMLDVDHFKQYNDRYGHFSGDECLKKIGNVLKVSLRRPSEFGVRYGGEEFAAILADTDLIEAEKMAERIRKRIEKLRLEHLENPNHPWVTVSLGVATLWPRKGLQSRELVELADRALYRAKKDGRNCVCTSHQDVLPYSI